MNITPSTRPHAALHPMAARTSVWTSASSADPALSVHVNVSTMIRPNSTSEIRSTGSRTRSGAGGSGS